MAWKFELAFACCVRVKRRRVDTNPGHGLQRPKFTRIQVLPFPSRGATTTTAIATAKSGRKFDNTNQDCCELNKHRQSEAEAKRISESYLGRVLTGASPAANSPTRRYRRRHRLFLSNQALVGQLKGSIPKLALLPQTVRVYSIHYGICFSYFGRRCACVSNRTTTSTHTASASPQRPVFSANLSIWS